MRRRSFLTATAGTAGLAGLAACSGGGGSTDETGSTLTLAPALDADPWDPKDGGVATQNVFYECVYDSLLLIDEDGEPTANLVTEWAYDETNTRLTLTLREGVTFTDGAAFDAEAVRVNLLNTKGGTAEAATRLSAVTDVEVVDAQTAVVVLSAPDPSLLTNFGTIPGMMASPQAVGTPGLATEPVGSGPYVLDTGSTTPGSKYTFTRNADYWNTEAFPYDTIVITPITDTTALINALRTNAVDAGNVFEPTSVATLEGAGLQILENSTGTAVGLVILDRAGTLVPALGDVRVRQAISMAFDRDAVVESVFQTRATATVSTFNPSSAAADPALEDLYPYDPDAAKALLAEAGYADGFDLAMPDLSAYNAGAQAAIVEYLSAIGINCIVESVPTDQLVTGILGGQWPVTYWQFSAFGPWDTIRLVWSDTATWNPFKFVDPQLSGLITQAQSATGADRDALYLQINQYVVEQALTCVWALVPDMIAHNDEVAVAAQVNSLPGIYRYSPAS